MGINISSNKVCLADRESIVSSMSFHYGVLVVKAELDQILCGLSETLHALQLIREYAIVTRPLFVHQVRPPLTADDIYDMMPAKFSDPGSNRREKEEATMMLWADFLKMVEGKVYFLGCLCKFIVILFPNTVANGSVSVKSTAFNFTLKEILLFTTGMPHEPPVGFTPRPSVGFNLVSMYPTANTCGNVLYLPLLHTAVEEFSWHMCFGIQNSAGFGKV